MTQQKIVSPQSLNKILSVVYCLIGGLYSFYIIIASIVLAAMETEPLLHLRPDKQRTAFLIFLSLIWTLLLCVTGLGLLKKRRWGRMMALVMMSTIVWFPPALPLVIYTWWFLKSKGGKQLYSLSSQ